jgi:aryl-alcohol dehydrogenase-like predicted oxidoreductase
MEKQRIGSSDLESSIIGLGCNNFGWRIEYEDAEKVVHAALDAGITFFDTADIYDAGRSEEMLGKALKGRRDEVIIATKVGGSMGEGGMGANSSRDHILKSCDESLKRLGTEHIDLYQIHTPDPNTPFEETMEALGRLVDAGKVRYVGHSNYAGWQIVEAAWLAELKNFPSYISSQSPYSILDRRIESEVIPAVKQKGLSLIPYFPLASGMLTGKYKRDVKPPVDSRAVAWKREERMLTEENFNAIEKLSLFALERGQSLLNLAFSWLHSQDFMGPVIAGATKIEQVQANAQAAEWKLSQDEIAEVRALVEN